MSMAFASQPSNSSSVVGGRAQGAGTPQRQLAHGRPQLAAVVGQLVDLRRRRRRQSTPGDDAVALEVAQPRGQDVGPDAGQVLDEVGVALRPVHQLADDEQRPAVADEVEGMCHRTVLLVALRHAERVPLGN